MKGNRSRVVKPALALWLLVLLADTAAAGGGVALAAGLAVVVVTALVAVAAVNRPRLVPARVRVRHHAD
jgi:hypothetical protein